MKISYRQEKVRGIDQCNVLAMIHKCGGQNKNEYKVQLNNDSNLYYIKPSKKNKLPKDDYPPFVNELPIKDCIYNNKNIFSLIIKDNTKSINLIKNKKTCGEGCLLF